MFFKCCARLVLFSVAAMYAQTALGAASPEEVAKLGGSLTPVGAERAGNGNNKPGLQIPEWKDGIQDANALAGVDKPSWNPFKDEKPVFVIDRSNYKDYISYMTPGQVALVERINGYTLPVYQSHRTCAYPKYVYDATAKNAVSASIDPATGGIEGASIGIVAPIPKNGLEVITNHRWRFRAPTESGQYTNYTVEANGGVSRYVTDLDVVYAYNDPNKADGVGADKPGIYLVNRMLDPARFAGTTLAAHTFLNGDQRVWVYAPGSRRVRLAPDMKYDAPLDGTDGLTTLDMADMFSGPTDRYNWVLKGKQEKLVSYNAFDLMSPEVPSRNLVGPKHVAQEHNRYELHRVWVVEANLKEGMRHSFSKRVLYIDEDSWTVLASELYDGRGQLWKVQEATVIPFPTVPTCFIGPDIAYDLNADRYIMRLIFNDGGRPNFFKDLKYPDFEPGALRRLGVR